MSTDQPTLHLTNWSSRKLHGPGRRFTMMRHPRAWEHGDGRVPALTPLDVDLHLVRMGKIDPVTYATRCRELFAGFPLAPGALTFAHTIDGVTRPVTINVPVADGDTLCCACSREAAARGECHRVVAAELLVAAGWRVLLDGVEVPRG